MGSIPWYRAPSLTRALAVQVAATLVLSIAVLPWTGEAALGVLLGGGICLLTTVYSGKRVFGAQDESPESALAGLYRAEVGKLVITGSLFVAVLVCLEEVNFIALCIAFVFIQIVGSIAASWAVQAPPRRT